MKPDGRILDENLGKLLQRAYVPALPRAEFRNELEREWLREVRRVATKRQQAGIIHGTDPSQQLPAPSLRSWGNALRRMALPAAAAALLLFFLGYSRDKLGRRSTPVPQPGDGTVALRELGSDEWRALDGNVVGLITGFEIRTAEGPILVAVPRGDTVRLGAETHATLRRADAEVVVQLWEGSLEAQRGALPPAPWRFRSRDSEVRLHEGKLSMSDDGVRGSVTLEEGRAELVENGDPQALTPGVAVFFGGSDGEIALGSEIAVDPRTAAETTDEETAEPRKGPGFFGVVIDEEGAPLPSFTVGMLPKTDSNDFREARTQVFDKPTGRFRWEGMPAHEYTVYVHAPGYALVDLGLHAFDEADIEIGTVTMTTGGTVRGFVVDEKTGNPIPDAFVLSEKDAPSSGIPFDLEGGELWLPAKTTTRRDGSYELTNLSAGIHNLRFSAADHSPTWMGDVRVDAENPSELGTVILGPGGGLMGTAVNEDGSPLVGGNLIVSMMDETFASIMNFGLGRTDVDGNYVVSDLPTGLLLAIFLGSGNGPPDVRPVQITAGKLTVLNFGEAQTGARLFGTITRPSGEPLALRNLSLMTQDAKSDDSSWKATTTDEQGRYSFESVEPGAYALLEVDNFGRWLSLIDAFEVPDWPEVEHDVKRAELLVEGRASSAQTGDALETWVIVEWILESKAVFAGFVRADAQGDFAIHSLPPGSYRLTSYATDGTHGFQTTDAFVLDSKSPKIRLALEHGPGTNAEVEVVDEEGHPVVGVAVDFYDEDGRLFNFNRTPTTDAKGVHSAIGIRPGDYRVVTSLEGYRPGTTSIQCRAGTPVNVHIRLEKSGD